MLEENLKQAERLKALGKERAILAARSKWLRRRWVRRSLWALLAVTVATLVIFPEQSGHVIGSWISDFFGTIIREVRDGG